MIPSQCRSVRELISAMAEEKINLKVISAKERGCKIVYAKAWVIEDEIMNDNPPKIVMSVNSPYRHQLISKSMRKLGFIRQGKHNHDPLWKMVL